MWYLWLLLGMVIGFLLHLYVYPWAAVFVTETIAKVRKKVAG